MPIGNNLGLGANPALDPGERIESAISSMGQRIEARRKAMGLTLDQVAERAGMSKSYIWEIENGKNKNPTIRTAWLLAGALGWTLSDVIGVWEHADTLHPEAMRIAVQVDWLLRPTDALAPIEAGTAATAKQGAVRSTKAGNSSNPNHPPTGIATS